MNNIKLKKLVKETLEKHKIEVGDKVSYINPKTKETETGIVSKVNDSETRLTVKMDDGSSLDAPTKQFKSSVKEESSSLINDLRNFINTNPALKAKSEAIRLQDGKNKVILKYHYWNELPTELMQALQSKYSVNHDQDEDEDTDTIHSYEITPKKQMSELYNKTKKYLDEAKVSTISKGDKFTLSSDLGKFKKGDEVEILDKKPDGDDIKLTLFNGKVKDVFYLDKNDDIDELNESAIATDYQFTPQQTELIKKFGGKLSTGGNDLYIPDTLKIQLDQNVKDSKFKQEFYETFGLERKNLASQLMTAMKIAINKGGRAKIKDNVYHVIKGHMTKNGNFNFPNPSRPSNK